MQAAGPVQVAAVVNGAQQGEVVGFALLLKRKVQDHILPVKNHQHPIQVSAVLLQRREQGAAGHREAMGIAGSMGGRIEGWQLAKVKSQNSNTNF